MSWLDGFDTHDATITGERQVGTEDDGFGGTQPVTETETLFEGRIRYQPSGDGMDRDFAGELLADEPVIFIDGPDVVDGGGQVAIREDDTLTIDGLDGAFEPRNIETHYMDSPTPELVICNAIRVD